MQSAKKAYGPQLLMNFCDSVADLNAASTMTGTGAYWGNGVVFMLNVGQERSPLVEINGGSNTCSVAFAAHGEYIVGGGSGLGVGTAK